MPPSLRRTLFDQVREAFSGRYEVEREIGRGGAARVFLARTRGGEAVALKVLHPELAASTTAERFLREIRYLDRVEHPLVSRVLEAGEQGIFVYYTMPFIEGEALRAVLDRTRQLAIADAVRIGSDLLDALGAAHHHGIVHRDVKPDNILIGAAHAWLVDFGIARAVQASAMDRLTRSGIAVGTSGYMSPEQIQALAVDERADLYSTGCVLFECLAGRPPFAHRSEQVVLQQHLQLPAPDVRALRAEVPAALAAVLARALRKDAAERWPSAAAMRAALRAAA